MITEVAWKMASRPRPGVEPGLVHCQGSLPWQEGDGGDAEGHGLIHRGAAPDWQI